MKKLLFTLIMLILIGAVGVGGYYHFISNHEVRWVKVEQKTVIDAVYGLGTVTAEKVWHAKTGILTKVEKKLVQEGDRVKKGQKLLVLTHTPVLKAPFSGIVAYLPIHEGEVVHPNTEVLELVDLNKRYILVSLEQKNVVLVKKGQIVDISFEAMRDKKFGGTVQKIYPSKGEFYVKIITPNFPPQILPDMTADVAIEVKKNHKAIVIPLAAVQDGQITVRRKGQPVKIKVKIKLVNEIEAEVLSKNINKNDVVLVQGR